ncbi:MAG: S1/P1 Nuclease [Caulobacteraceae bacterium]|nr:S1/P1 Nuclease [Caulobacteraceae bacterium]
MIRKVFAAAGVVALLSAGPALAWGPEGHRLVGVLGAAALPADVPSFLRTPQAAADIGEYAREPDRSKGAGKTHDTGRDAGHFVDVDDAGKVMGGPDLMALPTTRADYETALRAAQADTYKAGYLPYSIVDGWQQLAKDFAYWRVDSVAAKAEKDPKRKAWYVADLRRREELIRVNLGVWAHFIGDASQPLHLTIHYNGWGEGPNPEGFTTDRRTHSRFEDAFVGRFVTADMVRAKMTPYQACSQPVDACTARYLQTTWKTVVPFYQLEKAGGFKDGDPRGQAFAAERLAAGASALRDFVVDAWNASAKGTLGYPPVSVEDMVAGKVDPWDALYGVN